MTSEKAGEHPNAAASRPRVVSHPRPTFGVPTSGTDERFVVTTARRRWREKTTRLKHSIALATVECVIGSAGIAGASTWTASVTNGTHPSEAQSNAINAPTGGTATSPKSSSLTISWVKPSAGVTPTGYAVTRNGVAVPSGSGCYGTITATSCMDSALAASTTYTYSVKAKIGTNWTSVASSTFTGTTVATFVVSSITSTNASGNTVGKMGVGDTFAVTFNNAVNPSTVITGVGASTMSLVGGSSTTTIKISTLTSSSGFAVTSNYVSSGITSTATGTLSLSNANKTVTFTVTGTPTNASSLTAGSSSTFTFTPLATIQDTSGDTASTSYTQASALQIF